MKTSELFNWPKSKLVKLQRHNQVMKFSNHDWEIPPALLKKINKYILNARNTVRIKQSLEWRKLDKLPSWKFGNKN